MGKSKVSCFLTHEIFTAIQFNLQEGYSYRIRSCVRIHLDQNVRAYVVVSES